MKILFSLLFTIVFSFAAFAQKDVLTNTDVIDLTKAGLSEDIIIAKIKISKTNFDTSVDKLKELQTAKVSENVVVAMIDAQIPPAAKLVSIVIPEGTSFDAEMLETVTSDTNHEGDPITLKVTDDVTIGRTVVIKEGAIVKAIVSESSSSGTRGKAGSIRISFQYVIAADGSRIQVSGTKSKQGESEEAHSRDMTTNGNIFGVLVEGEKVSIGKGRIIPAYTSEDKEIKIFQ